MSKKTLEEKRKELDPMAEAFMKFCEEEFNVEFVDAEVEIEDDNRDVMGRKPEVKEWITFTR